MDCAPEHWLRRVVGKRERHQNIRQGGIKQSRVEIAQTNGHGVRRKGGDPVGFGRGGEELDYAAEHHIPTAVVPGISSAIALAGLQGVPLTYRGVSESFWVITGATTAGSVSKDLYAAAQTDATVVVLMGLNKLSEIARIYQEAGRGRLPVVVIQNGSLSDEKTALGTMDNIVDEAQAQQIGAPAVIIIGEVVAKHVHYGLKLNQEDAVAV